MKIDIRTNGHWAMAPDGFKQEVWDKWTGELVRDLVELEAEIAKEELRMSALPNLLKIALYEGYSKAVDDMVAVLGADWNGHPDKLALAADVAKSGKLAVKST